MWALGKLVAGWDTAGGQEPFQVPMTLFPNPVPMPGFHCPQAGGRGGGGLHSHPASPGRGAAEGPGGGDGPQGGRAGHLPVHGPGPAEVPAHHAAAALPQHGEHPAAPGLLHHPQHDPEGAARLPALKSRFRVLPGVALPKASLKPQLIRISDSHLFSSVWVQLVGVF